MSITDELRNSMNDIINVATVSSSDEVPVNYIGARHKIAAIADRIDAAHQEEINKIFNEFKKTNTDTSFNGDTREKLEKDIRNYLSFYKTTMAADLYIFILNWLDRQDVITTREVESDMTKAGHAAMEIEHERIAKLQAQIDKLNDENKNLKLTIETMNTPNYKNYLKLPVDADGRTIHFGDELDVINEPGRWITVSTIHFNDDNKCWVYGGCCGRPPERYRHRKPLTIGDLLQELVDDWDCAPDGEDKTYVLKEYAEKLQLKKDSV